MSRAPEQPASGSEPFALKDFLLARIRDEAVLARSVVQSDTASFVVANLPEPHFTHVVAWGPLRVLGECEAKRKVVERLASIPLYSDASGREKGNARRTLEDMALVYSAHADYREEWRREWD